MKWWSPRRLWVGGVYHVALTLAGCQPPPGADEGAARWQARAPIAGGARLEAGVVAAGGRVYVIGGFDSQNVVVGTVEEYDPEADVWRGRTALPRPLHHLNVAEVGGRIYVLGGLAGQSFTAVGDAFVYDPAADVWSPRAHLPAGSERGASALAVLDGRIYVAGGSRVDAVSDFAVYDPGADVWTALPALPAARYHAVGTAAGGRVLVVGGLGDVARSQPSPEVLAFDPVARLWTRRADMPTARGGCAAGVIEGELVCAGGEDASTVVVAATEAYDLAADSWRHLPPMRTPRAGTAGAVVDGALIVPGGARALFPLPVDTVEALTLR